MIYNDVRKFGFIKVEKTQNLNQVSHLKFLELEPSLLNLIKFIFKGKKKVEKKI